MATYRSGRRVLQYLQDRPLGESGVSTPVAMEEDSNLPSSPKEQSEGEKVDWKSSTCITGNRKRDFAKYVTWSLGRQGMNRLLPDDLQEVPWNPERDWLLRIHLREPSFNDQAGFLRGYFTTGFQSCWLVKWYLKSMMFAWTVFWKQNIKVGLVGSIGSWLLHFANQNSLQREQTYKTFGRQ